MAATTAAASSSSIAAAAVAAAVAGGGLPASGTLAIRGHTLGRTPAAVRGAQLVAICDLLPAPTAGSGARFAGVSLRARICTCASPVQRQLGATATANQGLREGTKRGEW